MRNLIAVACFIGSLAVSAPTEAYVDRVLAPDEYRAPAYQPPRRHKPNPVWVYGPTPTEHFRYIYLEPQTSWGAAWSNYNRVYPQQRYQPYGYYR